MCARNALATCFSMEWNTGTYEYNKRAAKHSLLARREVVGGELGDAADGVFQMHAGAEMLGREDAHHHAAVAALQNAHVVADIRQKVAGLVRNAEARHI